MVDTSNFFPIMVDALGNEVSTSPSTSRTQPGERFPRVSIGDMVHTQYRLITETLGIERLYAVMGIPMGGMQTFE
jgi:homoserine O-acetyltransferase